MAKTGVSSKAAASSLAGAVVVSGASRGVGRHTAEQLEQRGYRVYAGVLSAAEADSWTGDAVQRGRLVPVPLDITRDADIAALVARIEADGMPLRALVSVAGISQFDAIEHVDLKTARRIFDVNVFGTLALTQALLPLLKQSRGRYVFVTSMAARVSAPLLGVYSSTKAAMESLIDSLRIEVRSWGIDVAIVEPGGIRTTMVSEASAHLSKAIARCKDEGEASRRYVAAYQSIADGIAKGVAKYLPAEDVARSLVELVQADQVKTRYLVGLDAKAVVMLRRVLSDRLLDAVMAKQFKL